MEENDKVEREFDGNEKSANVAKRVVLVVLFGIGALVIGGWTYEWIARQHLLHLMLDSESHSISNDSVTQMRLKAILPKLIAIHRSAVDECGEADMTNADIAVARMGLFNRRISSWNALVTATRLARDPVGAAYVQETLDSGRLLPEETRSGRNVLEALE
jgi:hypothetical protein